MKKSRPGLGGTVGPVDQCINGERDDARRAWSISPAFQ
jgi:hypothetical protein